MADGRENGHGGVAAGGAVRMTALVDGEVQGVGFRWWTRRRATQLGLSGWARNLDDGRVEVVAEGPEDACRTLLGALRGPDTPGDVTAVVDRFDPPSGALSGFGAW